MQLADFPPLESQQTSVAALSASPVSTAAPTATDAAAVEVPRQLTFKTPRDRVRPGSSTVT